MPYRSGLAAAAILAAVALAGCGSQGQDDKPRAGTQDAALLAAATPATATPAAAPSGSGVTLSGTVKLTGPVPARRPIKMGSDSNCSVQHKTPVLTEDIVADSSGMLQNVFVYVKTGLEGRTFPAPTTTPTLDQRGCQYIPHVLGLMVNQNLDILNSDATLHNVHALPKVGEFNVGMAHANMKITRKFTQPEVMVHFKCDVHPWMSAWVGVLPHPFFAVSDAAGHFSIPNLPPGSYTIEAWQEKLGTQSQAVTVTAGAAPKLDFTFKPAGT